jgi:hypothetical protein
MTVHRATCSCSVALVYFGGFFAKLGYFAGFSLNIINLAVSISAATVYDGGGQYFFRVPNTLQGCDGWGGGGGEILYIKASLVQWKYIRLWQSSSGLKRTISRGFLCIFHRKDQQSCDGWAA